MLFYKPCYCGIVKPCPVVPILNEEPEVESLAQVRGVGKQLTWDNQLGLLIPVTGLPLRPWDPFHKRMGLKAS